MKEGGLITVELKAFDDTWIGPFTNYHWSKKTILEAAQKSGLDLVEIIPLKTHNKKEKLPDQSKYSLYVFERR